MPTRADSMMNPPVGQLLAEVEHSKYTLVTLAAQRARQINSYFGQLGEGLGKIVPPQVTSVARKPLSIAFEEIAAEKIRYEEYDPEAEAEAAAAAAAAAEFDLSLVDGGVETTGEGDSTE